LRSLMCSHIFLMSSSSVSSETILRTNSDFYSGSVDSLGETGVPRNRTMYFRRRVIGIPIERSPRYFDAVGTGSRGGWKGDWDRNCIAAAALLQRGHAAGQQVVESAIPRRWPPHHTLTIAADVGGHHACAIASGRVTASLNTVDRR